MKRIVCKDLSLHVNEEEFGQLSRHVESEFSRWRNKSSRQIQIVVEDLYNMSNLELDDLHWVFNCHRLGYFHFNQENLENGTEEKWASLRARWSEFLQGLADQYLRRI